MNGGGPTKVLTIWHTADAPGAKAFLQRVFSEDELLIQLLANLHKGAVENVELWEFGRLIFRQTLNEYFGIEQLVLKLHNLVASASDERKKELTTVLSELIDSEI